ncbi:MAG: hypothetical protein KDA78_00870 [Planctomycetaceae bacterium]|nr:hypothetical protein [Planctomycetaceae bacterium]
MKTRLWLSACCLLSLSTSQCFAQGWGSIKGKVVIDGAAPTLKLLVEKGDGSVKDANVCAAQDIPNRSLVANDKGELANCFVYLYTRDEVAVHPELQKPAEDTVLFDQKGCEFLPRSLVVRTDQKVKCISNDGCGHNVHTFPLKNQAHNLLVAANDQTGVTLEYADAEPLPMQVKCDIHPWMTAYWMVIGHPYAVVTDAEGNFEIKNLPAGEHTFRVWHERVGYIERALKVTIEDGKTTDAGSIKCPAEKLND